MPVAAVKTEADAWVPTLGRVNEILGKSMRVLAEFNFITRDSGANSHAEMTQLIEQQELCAVILNAFGKYSGRGYGSITIEIPDTHDVSVPTLTEKQRRAIAMIDRWLAGDEDEHAEALEAVAKGVDFHRKGYRTLFEK